MWVLPMPMLFIAAASKKASPKVTIQTEADGQNLVFKTEADSRLTSISRDIMGRKKETTVLLVRHGQSINNILSQDKSPKRYSQEGDKMVERGLTQGSNDGVIDLTFYNVAKEVYNQAKKIIDLQSAARDSLLSTKGEEDAFFVQGMLKQLKLKGEVNLFDGDNAYQAVYVSPMRRTIQTALGVFGDLATSTSSNLSSTNPFKRLSIPFKVAPWAHERVKTVSDWAHNKSILKDFVQKYGDERKIPKTNAWWSIDESLDTLPEDWSSQPYPDGEKNLSYYTMSEWGENGKPKTEGKDALCRRIRKLEQWITTLDETRIILVTHGGIISHLFDRFFEGRHVDNIGMFVGTLESPGDESLPFWRDVHTFRSELPRNPSWMPTVSKLPDDKFPQAKLEPRGKNMCPYHAGIVLPGMKHWVDSEGKASMRLPLTVKGQVSDGKEKKSTLREIAITADYAYLIRSDKEEGFDDSDSYINYVGVVKSDLLYLRNRELWVSNADHSDSNRLPPEPGHKSWALFGTEGHDYPNSFMLMEKAGQEGSKTKKKGGQVLMRFTFSDAHTTDDLMRKRFMAALAGAVSTEDSAPFA
eukprot:gnl/MRDRNA2_/MRDRNA2_65994_c0_seq1.p1 gnl/MRDRNA2_/MRDRNA2_65994_c0~~gnl/MRDRNA2_/MRDRNA2_65994_c0_seq1.p1  ORF type:complete len:584 (+),score=75.72 gnl/MRDRNA2_/MRDRNA2_65994_c0_seq1:70-1821(+)